MIGTIVGVALGWYYSTPPEGRSQEELNSMLVDSLNHHNPLGENPTSADQSTWKGIINSSTRTLEKYHQWAAHEDENEKILSVEKPYTKELTPRITLLAIPDVVFEKEGFNLIREHKCRGRQYREGDFGIDYQSASCCVTADCIGSQMNILHYNGGRKPYVRSNYIRSEREIDYYTWMFTQMGEDILSTPPERMYPQPIKRCACEYWELCIAEIRGLDMDDVLPLYRKYKEEDKDNDTAKNYSDENTAA
jgi:hypothetical protein